MDSLRQCQIRMPPAALDAYDERVRELNEIAGYEKHTRSDVMRDVLLAEIRTWKPAEKKERKK